MTERDGTTGRTMWRYGVMLAGCLIIGALVLFFTKPDKKPDPTPPKPSDQQSINIGIQINDSPGFSSMKDGQRNGFDIDLANYIAEKLNRHPNFIPITVDSREQQLDKGYVDLAISTYSISDKRIAMGVAFAGPYLRTDQGILVKKDYDSINTINDLAGRTVCVTKGSTTAEKLKAFQQNVAVVILERDTFTQCLEDLDNPSTNVVAITNDTVILQGHAHADDSLKVVPGIVIPGTYEKYGIGTSQKNLKLCKQVAGILKGFVNTQWNAAFTANIQLDDGKSNSSSLKPDPSTIDTESCRTE